MQNRALSGVLAALFHPRRDVWAEHSRFQGVYVEGLTPAGPAAVRVLDMNGTRRLAHDPGQRELSTGHGGS
jgi:hypothetical protein